LPTELNDLCAVEPVSFEGYERHALKRAREHADGHAVAAAELLAIGKSTMYRRLAVLQVK
jgi:transcriptional regulator of acetoin/glycerol metabolism